MGLIKVVQNYFFDKEAHHFIVAEKGEISFRGYRIQVPLENIPKEGDKICLHRKCYNCDDEYTGTRKDRGLLIQSVWEERPQDTIEFYRNKGGEASMLAFIDIIQPWFSFSIQVPDPEHQLLEAADRAAGYYRTRQLRLMRGSIIKSCAPYIPRIRDFEDRRRREREDPLLPAQ